MIAASIGKMSAPSPGFMLCGFRSVAGPPPSPSDHVYSFPLVSNWYSRNTNTETIAILLVGVI